MPIISDFSDTHSTKIDFMDSRNFLFGSCVTLFPFLKIIILAALISGQNYVNLIDFGKIPNPARFSSSQATLKLGSAQFDVAHNEPGSAILIELSQLEFLARLS